jgi:hypothetical protein
LFHTASTYVPCTQVGMWRLDHLPVRSKLIDYPIA